MLPLTDFLQQNNISQKRKTKQKNEFHTRMLYSLRQ